MRIYRDQGFAVIENIAAYNLNQLHVELLGNTIRITQLGSNRGEIRVHFTTIKDGFGNSIGETAQDVFEYVEDVVYEAGGNTSPQSKTTTLTLTPPASNQYTIALIDDDAIAGSTYDFTPLPNNGELEWNCLVVYGYSHIDGLIDVYVHAPTGLIVGDYEFKYRVV
jgi:hypothetical protein